MNISFMEEEVDDRPFHHFSIENITVARAPLLKTFYWEYLDVKGFNEKNAMYRHWEHQINMPPRQVNSKPLKMILWLRNESNTDIELSLKRIKNCDCIPVETRVGFNQFRQLYHCPHRRLINIIQEKIEMHPQELVAMGITIFFFLFGEHKLTYEVKCSDFRTFRMHFNLDIIGFEPQKCILTKELIPTNMREYNRFVQPIWVRNITMYNLKFNFSTKERGFKIINPELIVPRQSVWPLMVEYRPCDFENELEMNMVFENYSSSFKLMAKGYTDEMPPFEQEVPDLENDSADFLYALYPSILRFDVELGEERSLMVCLHNFGQKCMEFRWQSYVINELFEITFEPNIFRLKPHHSKLIVVAVRVFGRPFHFTRIPAVLEVHKIFDRSTKIAKDLLSEIESIDDPKWCKDSYVEHVFLHINIKTNMKPDEEHDFSLGDRDNTTIFEKLFWEYLSKSCFMRTCKTLVRDDLSYDEVLGLHKTYVRKNQAVDTNPNVILKILSFIIAEGLRELSKNWRFIPPEYAAGDDN